MTNFFRTLFLQLAAMCRDPLEERIVKTLDEVLAAVAPLGNKIDSLVALVGGLKQQLADALSGTLTPEQQQKVDAVFDAVAQDAAKVQAALDANAPPPVTPAP